MFMVFMDSLILSLNTANPLMNLNQQMNNNYRTTSEKAWQYNFGELIWVPIHYVLVIMDDLNA